MILQEDQTSKERLLEVEEWKKKPLNRKTGSNNKRTISYCNCGKEGHIS